MGSKEQVEQRRTVDLTIADPTAGWSTISRAWEYNCTASSVRCQPLVSVITTARPAACRLGVDFGEELKSSIRRTTNT